jgi:outer membrane protein TolC
MLLAVAAGLALATTSGRAGETASPPAAATPPAAVTPPVAISAPVAPISELVLPPIPSGAPTIVPVDRPITVKEAVAAALEHQSQIAIAAANAAAAAGRTRQALSAYFPTLSLSAEHNRIGPAATGGTGAVGGRFTVGGYTTSIAGTQLIYDFGKTPSQVGQARQSEESALDSLAQTRQDTVNQVKQAYYSLLQNQRLVEVQRSNVASQRAHLDEARARFTAGVAPRADVVTAETALASATFNLATAQNTAAVSRVTLNTALGIDVRTPVIVQQAEEPAPAVTPATLVEEALARRRDIAQLRAQVSAAENALRAARTTNLPDLLLVGAYGLRGGTFPGDTRSWSYGVSLQWPFFDVGVTRGGIEVARANVQGARAQLIQGEQTASSEVVQAYLNVQTAAQKVTSAAAEVANAEESVRVATGRYQAGVAIYIEVIDAQTAQVTARTDQTNALYGLSIARAALTRALGLEEQ